MGLFHSLDTVQPLEELTTPLMGSAEGNLSAATRQARAVANLGITATIAEIIAAAEGLRTPVLVPDATPYTILAADSGKTHMIAEQTANLTLNLPVIAAGLKYAFVSAGAATEAQSWIFVATTPSFMQGGVGFLDTDDPADSIVGTPYGNGTSHLTLTVAVPAAGTKITIEADAAGAEWVVNGIVIGATAPAFS